MFWEGRGNCFKIVTLVRAGIQDCFHKNVNILLNCLVYFSLNSFFFEFLSSHLKTNSGCQVQLYLSEVLDWYKVLKEDQRWGEKELSPTRKKLISTLEVISGYNAENLLKRLPNDALFEERAILLGKINQHHLALSLYVHKVEKS